LALPIAWLIAAEALRAGSAVALPRGCAQITDITKTHAVAAARGARIIRARGYGLTETRHSAITRLAWSVARFLAAGTVDTNAAAALGTIVAGRTHRGQTASISAQSRAPGGATDIVETIATFADTAAIAGSIERRTHDTDSVANVTVAFFGAAIVGGAGL